MEPVQIAAVRPAHHIKTGVGRLEQMRCVVFWPSAFCSPSVLLPTPQGCITPNRDMSLFVPAKVWTHAFRRSSKTRPLATTIHPSLAAADLRRPERIARNRARVSHCRDCDVRSLAEPEPNRQVFVKFKHLLRKAAARCPKPTASQSAKSSEHLRPPNAPPISETQPMPNPKRIML